MFISLLRSKLLVLFCLVTGLAYGQLKYNQTFLTHFNDGDPGGLAVADFNRDGLPDIGVIHGTTLSILFNQGSGNFGTPINTTLAPTSVSVEALAADVNNDGKLDLVIAQSTPMQIIVLLGNGDGTFQPPITLPLVDTPDAIALGDLNNDGKVDLAIRKCPSNSTSCDIAVYLGTGTGMFTPGTILPAPGSSSATQSLAVTDFNKDGKLDIATAALAGSSSSPTVNFSVFFGKGDGTFNSPVVVQVPFSLPAQSVASAPSIVFGDFNGDAVDDIGVETGSFCGGSACGESQMNIFLSNGAGGFAFKGQFNTSSDESPVNWRAADFNNDFTTDLARISGSLRGDGLETWINNGSGTFASIGNPYQTAQPQDGEFRDVDLDGRHDFVQADSQLGVTGLAVSLSQDGTPNCPPPGSSVLQAKMCSPGSTTNSNTITVQASGNSPVGIKRVELWIDGHKLGQTLNDQFRQTITLSTGTHQITIVAVDKYIGFAKATKSVNVQ
jgi:FG-GAP-like repeat/Bacterial Ig domain